MELGGYQRGGFPDSVFGTALWVLGSEYSCMYGVSRHTRCIAWHDMTDSAPEVVCSNPDTMVLESYITFLLAAVFALILDRLLVESR